MSNNRAKVSYILPYTTHSNHQHHKFGVNKLLLDAQNNHLFSAGRDGTIKCWESNSGSLVNSFEEHTDWVNDLLHLNETCMIHLID
jgi:WD40 repeat protein